MQRPWELSSVEARDQQQPDRAGGRPGGPGHSRRAVLHDEHEGKGVFGDRLRLVGDSGAFDLGSYGASTALPPPASATATVSPEALVPGPGLPKPVVTAWKGGDTVVLLVVRQGGIDDRLVHNSVRSLSSDPGVSVFVTRADHVARYSRITQGVGVSQAPALVVVRPKRVSGSVPEAQVDYGFRDAQGVVQAVHDAVHSGKDNLPYSPR